MEIKNKDLKRRILEISYKYKLSHLGSCLTAVDIIDEIYGQMISDMHRRHIGDMFARKAFDFHALPKFVLSSGHAGLALYVVLEKYFGIDAEKIFNHHGVHPDRCEECHIDCSAGSLGMGLPIAVGMALADRSKNVYCLISDGECSEGSIWEALHIAFDNGLHNLKVYVNFNGWGAYRKIPVYEFRKKFEWINFPVRFIETNMNDFPFLKGQDAHYHVMTEEEYKEGMEILG